MDKASFYCKECRHDQDSAYEVRYYLGEKRKFVAPCELCGLELIRLPEEPGIDPYHKQSLRVKIMRDQFKKDLIQPGEEGFQMLYRKQWLELEKVREEQYKKNARRNN